MDSILQKERRCFVCGALSNLHEHHIFYGTALRKVSEQHGFKVRLCQWHHTGKEGVHFDKKLDTWLKRVCQAFFESKHGRERWMEIVGRNYLDDD